jgi:hypothetical protein
MRSRYALIHWAAGGFLAYVGLRLEELDSLVQSWKAAVL